MVAPISSTNLVEAAAVGEVRLLRLLPAAEGVVDGYQLELGELLGVLRATLAWVGGGSNAWRNLLAFLGVQIIEVGLAVRARAALLDHLVDHHATGGLGEDGEAGMNDLELVLPSSLTASMPSFSQVTSTSPRPRSTKVVVEPRAPESSTGTFLKMAVTSSFAFCSLPPGC